MTTLLSGIHSGSAVCGGAGTGIETNAKVLQDERIRNAPLSLAGIIHE